ncbi:MAG: hypothetical protein ACYTAQ_03460 [Planctomycetota bacterium]|jgi:hypothetical protein
MVPDARIILLGGSNLARGFSTVVEIARRTVGGVGESADFLIAMGHGRSYGKRSTVLGRSLPGITECGLWDALDRDDGRPTYALITDIGNDVAYGAPVPAIAGWVELCVERLAEARTRTVITTLPLESLRTLSPWRFKVARSILFPAKRLSLDEALGRTQELDDRIRGLAAHQGVRIVEQEGRWYGLDPIHIKQRHVVAAWTRVLGAWRNDGEPLGPVSRSVLRWARLRLLTPQRWWLLGSQRGRPQPAGCLPDGSRISLF